jgi:hypothetical protein
LRSQCEAITAIRRASPQMVALSAEDEAILADRLRQLGYLE